MMQGLGLRVYGVKAWSKVMYAVQEASFILAVHDRNSKVKLQDCQRIFVSILSTVSRLET